MILKLEVVIFGVYKFWDEVKAKYPHFQFAHSYGLGVLFPKGCSDKFEEILKIKKKYKIRINKWSMHHLNDVCFLCGNNDIPLNGEYNSKTFYDGKY